MTIKGLPSVGEPRSRLAGSGALHTLALRRQTANLREKLRSVATWRKDPQTHAKLHELLAHGTGVKCVCECSKQSADRIAEKAARVSANNLTGAPVRKYNVDTPGEVEISKTGVLNAALARLRGDRASVQLLRFVLVVVTQAIEAPMDCFALAQCLADARIIRAPDTDGAVGCAEKILREAAAWNLIKMTYVGTGFTERPMLVDVDRAAVALFVTEQAAIAMKTRQVSHHGNDETSAGSTALVPRVNGAVTDRAMRESQQAAEHAEWALAVWRAIMGHDGELGEPISACRDDASQDGHQNEGEGEDVSEDVERVLGTKSFVAQSMARSAAAIHQVCTYTSVCQRVLYDQYRRPGVIEYFCDDTTRDVCVRNRPACTKLHFKIKWMTQTDLSLGGCSYATGCFNIDKCKCIHYILDEEAEKVPKQMAAIVHRVDMTPKERYMLPAREFVNLPTFYQYPAQWINCDVRTFDYSILGKFGVVMADPPWAIHMDLPYGTMEDDEMKRMSIPVLQDDGFIFLWVTMRALELARDCLDLWGYRRIDELIWVKTNQLQQLMRVGRTGHYINHSKEHCLVGVKGNPKGFNPLLDTDVLVAELRATSRKPDEMYALVERFFPGTRKIELFGRPHNTNPGWVTLGNQLETTRIYDPDLKKRYNARYPEHAIP